MNLGSQKKAGRSFLPTAIVGDVNENNPPKFE